MEKLRTVRGVHDLLPYELHKHNLVINKGLEISDKYNYSLIEIPIFEFAEVFTRPLGKSSDIVTKENYIFKDRSEENDLVSQLERLAHLKEKGLLTNKEFMEAKKIILIWNDHYLHRSIKLQLKFNI